MRYFIVFCLMVALMPKLLAHSSGKRVKYPENVKYIISNNDTFEIIPKKDWDMYSFGFKEKNYGSIAITNENSSFSLLVNFANITSKDVPFKTENEFKAYLQKSVDPFFNQSEEKITDKKLYMRNFNPYGRYGYVTRLTNKDYPNPNTQGKNWKYMTCGGIRLSDDSVLFFNLHTDFIDTEEYVELLEYISSFIKLEQGEKNWKVANAKEAYNIAKKEFFKTYKKEQLYPQMPFSVSLKDGKWIVTGNMWKMQVGGVARCEIDGATGKVLKVIHGK